MAKPELGEKRVCGNCGAKFYDLNRDPIVCPKCDTVFEVAAAEKPAPERESKKPAPVAESEDEKDDAATVAGGPEIISLEDADEDEGETVDGDDIPDDVSVDIEDDDDDADDDTFLATDDDDDDDVSDILPVNKDDEES